MPVSYRSGSQVNYGSRTNTTITAPAGILDDDQLLIIFQTGLAVAAPVPSPPAGFVLSAGPDFPFSVVDENNFNVKTYAWTKRASGESGDYLVTHSACNSTAFMLAIEGADTSNPYSPTPTTNTGFDNLATALSITTPVDACLIVYWVGGWDLLAGFTPPGGATPTLTVRNTPANSLLAVATGSLAVAGATGNKSATVPNTATQPWVSGLFSLQPPAAVVAAGLEFILVEGSEWEHGQVRSRLFDFRLDNSYPTGGYPITPEDVALVHILDVSPVGRFLTTGLPQTTTVYPQYDYATGKLQLFRSGASAGDPFVEASNGTDFETTIVRIRALGY